MSATEWRTTRYAGHSLRYALAGSGPVVVLPKKDRHDYVPFDQLADRFKMVQVEPLGFGRSDRPVSYPAGGLHEQILAVCDVEGITDFAVWGYSQGGAMACAIAQATSRAQVVVCGGFNVLRGLSDGWLARMNQERRIPVASRTFWNWFHAYDWYVELRRLRTPMLTYFGSLDRQRVSVKDQNILRGLGIDVVEFAGLDHGRCGLGDPGSPATATVTDWLQAQGWRDITNN